MEQGLQAQYERARRLASEQPAERALLFREKQGKNRKEKRCNS